ncbi:MAG: cytochrome c [Polyangiaceae bacterium]
MTDSRPVVTAATRPPAVTGGTLLALSDGRRALVTDPDRDRIWLVDYLNDQVQSPVVLEAGAMPSRAVEDKSGHAYVVLRGTGELLTVDLSTAQAGERRAVCATPRGVVLEPAGDKLLVACAEGRLVQLPLSGPALGSTPVPLDVRDVVFQKDRLFLTRFRSSELLELSADRQSSKRSVLPSVAAQSNGLANLFEPAVAWRAAVHPNGNSLIVVHQRATTNTIDIDHPTSGGNDGPVPTRPTGSSAYGGDFSGCGGIVQSTVTVVQDGVAYTGPQIGGAVLPVDVAVSRDGYVAIASAGSADQEGPSGFGKAPVSSLVVLNATQLDRSLTGECLATFNTASAFPSRPLLGVAFTPGDSSKLLALGRQPLSLFVVDQYREGGKLLPSREIELPGVSVTDTGHDIFHRDSGGGIACASCHPEGTDDGRVWNFAPSGARRTQPIDVGLADTAPFHWDGDLASMDKLLGEVFVRRMGGPIESSARAAAVQDWVFGLTPRAPVRVASDSAAERGAELFKSREVGCSGCHSGPKFSSTGSVDVGTGGKFQIPSLLGVAQRVPVMHDGCAKTLRDRFDATCGGSAHGKTSQLKEEQLADLVAYLETL